jgi:glutathione S-transferase
MAIDFYWGSGSPYAWRVMLMLEAKQLSYNSHLLSFSANEHKKPEILALNPRGKVPVLKDSSKDGDVVVAESVAIMAYLDTAYPQPVLFGDTPAQTAAIWQSIMQCVSEADPQLSVYVHFIFTGKLAEKRDEIIASRQKLEAELQILEKHLVAHQYLVGNVLSAADMVWYPIVKIIERAGMRENTAEVSGSFCQLLVSYPAIAQWCKRVEQLPGYEKTYPPHWR